MCEIFEDAIVALDDFEFHYLSLPLNNLNTLGDFEEVFTNLYINVSCTMVSKVVNIMFHLIDLEPTKTKRKKIICERKWLDELKKDEIKIVEDHPFDKSLVIINFN